MRVVITGAAGRLGRSVAAALTERGHEVTGLDLGEHPDGIVVDLLDPEETSAALERLRPDAVVHLAAIAVPFSAPEHRIFTVNTGMAFTVLEAAVHAGARRVLAASSPTVAGYGPADWRPSRLPLTEAEPPQPTNAYALSKVVVEQEVAAFARAHPGVRFGAFRPCYVIAPEEWAGAPTQQGHTIVERLRDPALAAVSLYNYVDARDAGGFVDAWLSADDAPSGAVYLVGATDALATAPLAELLPRFHPALAGLADVLTGTAPAFDVSAAERDLGWRAQRTWRGELPADLVAALTVTDPERTIP